MPKTFAFLKNFTKEFFLTFVITLTLALLAVVLVALVGLFTYSLGVTVELGLFGFSASIALIVVLGKMALGRKQLSDG